MPPTSLESTNTTSSRPPWWWRRFWPLTGAIRAIGMFYFYYFCSSESKDKATSIDSCHGPWGLGLFFNLFLATTTTAPFLFYIYFIYFFFIQMTSVPASTAISPSTTTITTTTSNDADGTTTNIDEQRSKNIPKVAGESLLYSIFKKGNFVVCQWLPEINVD